jgi:hypothetical protein
MKSLTQLKSEIQKSGKFFSVRFIKKDGQERFLRGRFGVHKFVKGGVSTLKSDNWNFFDMNDGYRSVKPDSILEVVYDHEIYSFCD